MGRDHQLNRNLRSYVGAEDWMVLRFRPGGSCTDRDGPSGAVSKNAGLSLFVEMLTSRVHPWKKMRVRAEAMVNEMWSTAATVRAIPWKANGPSCFCANGKLQTL